MRKMFLLQRIRKNDGSLLVGVVSCVMLFFFCMSMLNGIYLNTLHTIHLEKMQRIGKVMIHSVWQELKKQDDIHNTQVVFNVGVVDIAVSDEKVTLTSRLQDGYVVEQVYARIQNKESAKEKNDEKRE